MATKIPMSVAQAKFVEIEKQRKAAMEAFDAALMAVQTEIGMGGFFQDEEGVVYQIVKPEGRWVKFDSVSYIRTRRGDEKQGTLSATKAKEAGFEL